MNVCPKRPITWNHSSHAFSWQFYLHCWIEETGSPDIIYIVSHQVLGYPSEHGTSSMGKHLLAKAHIAKLNELTQWEVADLTSSTVDETALVILRRQGSWGITILSSERKIIFDIQVTPFWSKWQTKCSKLAAKDFETSKLHQDMWNHYLLLGFVSAHIPWIIISNLALWQSYITLRCDLVLPSCTTLRNICGREYALTLDAIKMKLQSQNKVSFALDWWTLKNKLS